MPFLILLFPVAEVFLFYKFSQAYSFVDAVFLVGLAALIGLIIFRLLGKSTLVMMQKEMAQGKIPANQILHRAFVIMGAILLMIPGFITDIFGIFAILPGSRHLMVAYMKNKLKNGALRGRVFTTGFGFPGGFPGAGFPPGGAGPFQKPVERDAQVVDIEPIEITHTKKNEP